MKRFGPVLGDNRDRSHDSRFFGPVPMANLRGRLLYVYWSKDRGRIGRSLAETGP
jgi:signal peptidase I